MVEALIQKGLDYLNNNGVASTIIANPVASTAIAGGTGLIVGGAVGSVLSKRASKKRKSIRKHKTSRKGSSRSRKKMSGRKLKFGSPAYRKRYLGNSRRKQKQPYTARKRKDTSTRRIRFTKNNQPYIILSSGKAKFISKKSASLSRRKKGGKY